MTAQPNTEMVGVLGALFSEQVVGSLPKVIVAVSIASCGIVLAYVIRTVCIRIGLKMLPFVLRHKHIATSLSAARAEQSVALMSNIFYWVVVVFFVTVATEILGLSVVGAWLSGITTYLPRIFVAILIGFVGIAAGSIVRNIVSAATGTAGLPYSALLGRGLQYLVVLLTALICIEQIGIEITLLTNILTLLIGSLAFAMALSFGLGAKSCVGNILGTYYLQKQYAIGSRIRVGETEGQIVRITSMNVIVETDEGQVSIPSRYFHETCSVLLHKEAEHER